MLAWIFEMDTKTMVTSKSELTFSERLSQRLKMQVLLFKHCRVTNVDQMPAKIPSPLSLQMIIQPTSKQRVSWLRKAYTEMHSQKSVGSIRKLKHESKHHLGGLLPALQCLVP